MGCLVQPTNVTVNIKEYVQAQNLTWLNKNSAALQPSNTNYFDLFKDPCSPNVITSISSIFGDGLTALTQTLFQESGEQVFIHSQT